MNKAILFFRLSERTCGRLHLAAYRLDPAYAGGERIEYGTYAIAVWDGQQTPRWYLCIGFGHLLHLWDQWKGLSEAALTAVLNALPQAQLPIPPDVPNVAAFDAEPSETPAVEPAPPVLDAAEIAPALEEPKRAGNPRRLSFQRR